RQSLDARLAFHRRELQVCAHEVPAFLREEDEVARARLEHFAALEQPDLAAAFGEEMEERDVLGAGEALAHAGEAELAPDAPRRGELGVEIHRAFEADRLKGVCACT